jgi:hypothetical protein
MRYHEHIRNYILKIIRFYATLGKKTYYNNGIFYESGEKIFSRLERAAFNECYDNRQIINSRYGMWAADLRAILEGAVAALENRDCDKAQADLYLAINALGAYIDIQAAFDSLPGGMQLEDPDQIISAYPNQT